MTERQIKYKGILTKNTSGRYELCNHTYTCGSEIEYKYYDEKDRVYKWAVSRVEGDINGEYYIVGYNGKMDGLEVIIRG